VPSVVSFSPVMHTKIVPYIGLYQTDYFPNYWKFKYVTGFDKLPMDLVNFIGKMAAVNIFAMLGDIVFGAGVQSRSLSIDGLSQSISTTKGGATSAYGARIAQYTTDLREALPKIRNNYTGIRMACC